MGNSSPRVRLTTHLLQSESIPHLIESIQETTRTLQAGIDLVVTHELYRPFGGQTPVSAVNPPTVLIAVAAWERFCGDLAVIAHQDSWLGPNNSCYLADSYLLRPPTKADPGFRAGWDATVNGNAANVLVGLTGSRDILDAINVKLVHNWRGSRPILRKANGPGLRDQDYSRPDLEDQVTPRHTIGEVVYQSVKLRSAVAHSYIPAMGIDPSVAPYTRNSKKEPDENNFTHWLDRPKEQFWLSNKADGLSVQSGCARGVLALFIQLIDNVIVGLANSRENDEDRQLILSARLPEVWFTRTYPGGTQPGVPTDLSLWRGQFLTRSKVN